MRDQSPGLVTLIVLALGGILIPQVAGSRSAVKKEPSAAPAAQPAGKLLKQGGEKRNPTDSQKKREGEEGSEEGGKDAFDLLADFLGRPQHHIAFTVDKYDAEAARKKLTNLLDGINLEVQSIIVTVPDPVDSILDYTFDRHIDAIQRAQQKMGFVIDRYWLPWEKQRRRIPQSGPPAPEDEEQEDVNPGVMLFRNLTGPDPLIEGKLSIVFLVPETPASGLHKNSLRKALLDTLVLRTVTGNKGPVRILGPFFSGSALSLRLGLLSLLSDDRTFRANALNVDRPSRVEIISGSATNFENKKILEEFDPAANGAHELPVNVTFKATVLPDIVTRDVLYRYLKRAGIDVVAELTESGTSYGQGLATASRGGIRHDSRDAAPQRPPTPDLNLPKVLTIRFPINISQVRAASERNRALQAAQAAPVTEGSPSSIELSLDETAKPLDVVPALSAISPASEELVLSALLSTIAHRKISAVGIFATDVRDKLFLGRQVALNCPGVTLFTLDGDVLFAHPQYVQYFRGMLVASTYPLYNPNQKWTSPGAQVLSQFASSPSEGSFNAFLALSGGDQWLTEYSSPLLQLKEAMYKNPSLASGTQPPAWLSVIGSHSVWPLNVDPGYGSYYPDALKYLYTPGPAADVNLSLRFHVPLESSSAFVLLSILALACSVALLATNRRQVRTQPRSLGAPFHIDLSSPARPRKHMGLFLFSAASAIVYVHAAGLYFLPVRFARHAPDAVVPPGWVGTAAAGVVLILTLCAVALLAWLGSRREFLLLSRTWHMLPRLGPGKRRNAPRWRVWFRRVFEHLSVAAASVTILLALIETVVAAARPLDAATLFFFDRAVNPASGLSISLPIFLAGLASAFLGFCHVWRLTLSETCPISSPLGGPGHAVLSSIERLIRARILGVWVRPESALFVAISLAIPLTFLAKMLKTPVDDVTFVWLFRFVLFFVCLGILTSAVRFLSLWHELHRFLRHVASLPLAEAFKRLPDRFSGVVGLRINSRGLDDADTETILDAGNSLSGKLSGAASQLTALSGLSALSLLNVDSRLQELAPYYAFPRRSRLAYGALRDAAASVFSAIDGKSAPASTSSPAAAAWFMSAEEFVAFQIVAFISYVCEHLRNLLTAFLAPSFLLFLSLVLYPFRPARILLGFMFVFVSVLAVLTVRMLAQMEREEILSLISRTAPGKVSWDFSFVSRVLIYGVFPILSLLAANIPDVQALLTAGIVNVSRLLH